MSDSIVTVSMTSFARFCIADSVGQLAQVRDIRRQYEQEYRPATDFWSRFREGVAAVHKRGGGRDELKRVLVGARDNRVGPYASALDGYHRFWGQKQIEYFASLTPAVWVQGRLHVRVNPEFLVRIDRVSTVLKLHLTARIRLSQRLANPLLYLMACTFGGGDRTVALLDVHRGKLWTPSRGTRSMEDVLRMQAAAFLVGWDACTPGDTTAA